MKWLIALLLDSRPWREGNCRLKFLLSGVLLTVLAGCATPGLMKRWEREEQSPIESRHFVIFVDEGIDRAVGLEVLDALEFARERVGQACGYYCDDKIICNLYRTEQNLRNISVGLPLGFFVPRRTPLAYVLGGEVHGRLYSTPTGNVSRLWASTFAHEYCHVMFKKVTGRQYFQYSWLQEGLGEYFRQLYLQEKVLPPSYTPGEDEIFLLSKNQYREDGDSKLYIRDNTHGIWTYTDWEVRDALRYDTLPAARDLSPKTFIGYWRAFNTPRANQIYAISSSLVEFLVNEYGWRKMRQLLIGLHEDRNLDRVMEKVYGYDQDGLDQAWRRHLKERWPDPWQPNIAMVYLVRGNWEIDGHESGIRLALNDSNIDAARRHRRYLESRRISPAGDHRMVMPVAHQGRFDQDPRLADPVGPDGGEDPGRVAVLPLYRAAKAPAIEHYEAAMACYSIGRFQEGIEHLRLALQIEPEQVTSLRVHLARGLWLVGQKEEAIRLYQEELLEAKDLPFINEIAWCFERAGQKQQAIRVYHTIAESCQIPGLKDHALRRIDRLTHEPPEAASEPVTRFAFSHDYFE